MRGSISHALLAILWSSRSKFRAHRLRVFAMIAVICAAMGSAPASAQVTGQNVNMVSGTDWTNGDPFLQRQNEPSIAVSSRNSSHLLAGSNDYRTVDLPGLLGIDERGDAWLGLFKSFDGGRTWQSTLLPGFPLDGSIQGQASPIHGFQAASDPTVRAGTNGLLYYTGLAFNRGNNPRSAVFVSRFIDLNNKENGDATFEGGSMGRTQRSQQVSRERVEAGHVPQTASPIACSHSGHHFADCGVGTSSASHYVRLVCAVDCEMVGDFYSLVSAWDLNESLKAFKA